MPGVSADLDGGAIYHEGMREMSVAGKGTVGWRYGSFCHFLPAAFFRLRGAAIRFRLGLSASFGGYHHAFIPQAFFIVVDAGNGYVEFLGQFRRIGALLEGFF